MPERIWDRKINRRKAMSLGITAAAGAVWGLAEVKSVSPDPEPLSLPHGEIYINFQDHSIGNAPGEVPQGVHFDFFWREAVGGIYSDTPQQVLRWTSGYNPQLPIVQPEKLVRFAREGTLIVFGDVNIPEAISSGGQILEAYYAATIDAMALFSFFLPRLDAWRKRQRLGPTSLSRRRFNTFLGIAALYLTTRYAYPQLASLAAENTVGINTQYPNRLAEKIAGEFSLLHPEDLLIFFRNVVMAHKILWLMEYLSKKLGRPVKVYAEFGAQHGAIKNFMKVGMAECENTLRRWYPQALLQLIVEQNNSLSEFSSMRAFALAEDFDPARDLFEDKMRPISTIDTVFLDQPLFAALQQAGVA